MSYYDNVNPELFARIPATARRILEIGCGVGEFARAVRAANPDTEYWGVELFAEAADAASALLDAVIVGDIETTEVMARLDRARGDRLFDVLIFGDVLEHLNDPWRILAELRTRVSPGGVCVACVPNVSNWRLIKEQLSGRWTYTDAGLLDRTHLRFFTRDSAVTMLRDAGWTVTDASPRVLWPEETAEAIKVLTPAAEALGASPAKAAKDLAAFQWVVRGVNGPMPDRLTVAALGLKKIGGVTEARVDHPTAALASLPGVNAAWGAGTVTFPKGTGPGVFVLHRQFLHGDALSERVEQMIGDGWTVVSDMDDDPHHWPEYVNSDFRAFRGVHAVTVSTEPLADMIRPWNPNVMVFPNAMARVQEVSPTTPKADGRLKVFFGALNREGDWSDLLTGLFEIAQAYSDRIDWEVVHDRAFFDALPPGVRKSFQSTLPHPDYMRALGRCDIALLPLADTPFNRLKSDLKLIETAAAGAVAICSPVVYDADPTHADFAVFARTSAEWRDALLGLMSRPDEVARRRALGLAHVRAHRMHAQQTARREAFYRDIKARREDLEAERLIRLSARASAV